MIEIELREGKVLIIDDIDSDLLNLKWAAMSRPAGRTSYAYRGQAVGTKQSGLMHRMIMSRMLNRELSRDEHVDHRNRNGLDNRRENLRIATRSQNRANSKKPKHSDKPYKGVFPSGKHGRWKARIRKDGKNISLGGYATQEEAYAAYCEAAVRLYGEYAKVD